MRPAKGEVAVFNRSHYEDVLVTRVHKLVPKKVWERRYELINQWERLLFEENGTTILKFCLVVSKEEQLRRFAERLDDPDRQWKISNSDYKERAYFDDYLDAFDEALERTSTPHAPVVHHPLRHEMVPQPGRGGDRRRRDGGDEARSTPSPPWTSRRSARSILRPRRRQPGDRQRRRSGCCRARPTSCGFVASLYTDAMQEPMLFALTVLIILGTPGPADTLLATAGASVGVGRALP